jgi:hypothetical protein
MVSCLNSQVLTRYLYDSEYDDLIESELPHFEVSEISLSQSIQVGAQQCVAWCLDVCATPQLDTVTLRPAPSGTVTIRPMSCCGLATQLQLYD